MAKRANSEGTVYKRADGKWVGALTLPNGGRKVFYGKTRTEVHTKLVDAQGKLAAGVLPTGPTQTLAQFMNAWLIDSVKPSVRPKTFDDYQRITAKHILPELGKIALSKLSPAHLQRFYRQKLDSGLSPRTVQYQHAILHRALHQAERWSHIGRNPAALVDPPRAEKANIRALDAGETRRFLAVAAEHRLDALWTLAVYTGMRQGEILGLLWSSVDLTTKRLTVDRTIQRVGGETIVGEPKSAQSRRTIPLPAIVVEQMLRWRTQQKAELLRLGIVWPGDGSVFTSEVGKPLIAHSVLKQYKRLLAAAMLPSTTFHALRHGAASALVAANVPAKVIQELLGHSSITVTLDLYAHLMDGQREQAIDALANVFAARV